ncbi:MAG: arginine--tRNA ligase [Candidatus Heimdallarchaeota archaeon]|nr:arginine--tRNA ligase [Candidatus Heimdallarchaeota archaeon]
MVSDPEAIVINKIQKTLQKTLKKLNIPGKLSLEETSPKKASLGDYSAPVFPLAKQNQRNPIELAKEIVSDFPEIDLVSNISATNGFINFKLNRAYYAQFVLSSIMENENFGENDRYKGQKILVEHTSANPNGPIHIGNFRGSVIGDTFAKILQVSGAEVFTNFYVDDLGRQIPIMVIGYELVKKYGEVPKDIKIDYFLGRIYGITHTMFDIQQFKQELFENFNLELGEDPYWLTQEYLGSIKKKFQAGTISEEKFNQFQKKFQFLFDLQSNISSRYHDLYSFLKKHLAQEELDLPARVAELNRQYMHQETQAVEKIREACEDNLEGQKEELALLNIYHDHYDWESDLQWSGEVEEAQQLLEEKSFIIKDGKARLFDANKAADLPGAREYLDLKSSYEVPNAILVNSEGESLYLLRDIPYSLKKVDDYQADRVFNVIGKGQELTQLQLNLALRALGRSDAANKLWHLNYEFIELKGTKASMSGRRLRYVTPLDIFQKTKAAVLENFLKERDYPSKEKEEIAKIVAIGAIKYAITAIGLTKKLLFDPVEVISLTNNTSPFIQYAYARSQNILAKTDVLKWTDELKASLTSLTTEEEWSLIRSLAKLPSMIKKAAKEIRPEIICTYLFQVATLFNKFYEVHRVLDAPTEELVQSRLVLTSATGRVLQNALKILGITSPARM